MGKKALPKAKARPRALPKVSAKYGYLPPDLQRAGQHMERVAFLRNLQKSMADQPAMASPRGGSLGRFASWNRFARGRSRSPRVAAEAGSSTQPMVFM